jgi:arsenate reductase-like glutaredoxin family protein
MNDVQERQELPGRARDCRRPDRPVFKTRPLPTSKTEAIDMMMENPNLIRRPILVRGPKVTFGFDRDEYQKLK